MTRNPASCGARRRRRSAVEQAHYSCTHGFGYTRFTQRSHGLALELTLLVPGDDPVKICRLRIRNDSGRQRSLSVTAYVEWVLGPARVNSAPHIITESDATTGALLARNPWNHAFPGVAFADLGGRQTRMDLRPARVSGAPRGVGCAGGAGRRHGVLRPHGRGARSLRRAARAMSSSHPATAPSSSSC